MTNIPSYLKLHAAPTTHESDSPDATSVIEHIRKSFENTTGLPLRHDSPTGAAESPPAPKSRAWNSPEPVSQLALDAHKSSAKAVSGNAEHAADHVAAINTLLRQLHETRHALWKREAELATGIPVVRRGDEQPIARRLESILEHGVAAAGAVAASLYLLDDATSQLKLRATWGLPHDRLLDGPRPLQGAVADLEAMLGHAVLLNAENNAENWRPPEPFPASLCVPVSSQSTVLGTLWMYGEDESAFDTREIQVVELLSGRLASELERDVLLSQSLRGKDADGQLSRASRRQKDRLPTFAPLLDHWQVAGWTNQADTLGGDFHDWAILPDGTLSIAVGDAEGQLYEAGLTAATLHAAIKAHAGYRHNPKQMVQRANESLWSMSAGDQFASLAYCLIDPQSGVLEHCAAGQTGAVVVGRDGHRILEHDVLPLGAQPDDNFRLTTDRLQPGELLIAFSEGVRKAVANVDQSEAEEVLAAAVRGCLSHRAEEIADHIHDLLATYSHARAVDDRTVVVVKRI